MLAAPATIYTVKATDPEGGTLTYHMHMTGEACGTPLVPWDQTGAVATWTHSSDKPDNCQHKGTDHNVDLTVTVTSSKGASTSCTLQGSETTPPDAKPNCHPVTSASQASGSTAGSGAAKTVGSSSGGFPAVPAALGAGALLVGAGAAAWYGVPRWAVAAAVGVVAAVAVIGFAVTRLNAEPNAGPVPLITAHPAPTPSPPAGATPIATAAPAPVVTSTKIAEAGNVCLNATTLTVTVQTTGAQPGDTVHLALTGPGLPSSASGTLDANGAYSGVIGTVGPVKGNQSWTATVDAIAGRPAVGPTSSVTGFCP